MSEAVQPMHVIGVGIDIIALLTADHLARGVGERDAGRRSRDACSTRSLQLGKHVKGVHAEEQGRGGIGNRSCAQVPLADGGPEAGVGRSPRP